LGITIGNGLIIFRGDLMKKYLLLLLLLFLFSGCSFQAVADGQDYTLKRIQNSEYDFSVIKTEKEFKKLSQKLDIM
jgi:PBP1b-binding outer membrane lipoprotein LpoB